MQHLDLKIEGGLATVTLNRPAKKMLCLSNCLMTSTGAGLLLQQTPNLRAVILTGAGSDFCSGIDLQFLQSLLPRLDDVRGKM